MTAIKLIAETKDTVTIRRIDLNDLLSKAEAAEDISAIRQARAREDAAGGYQTAKRGYYSAEEAKRLLDGESPLRVWRQKRGLTQRALAAASGLQTGYLSEIENAKKPGSAIALKALAQVLDIPMEYLVTDDDT
jgi:DNA-binding XRE family transcriptional regulator